MVADIQRAWYYFGCRYQPGHRLFDKQGKTLYLDSFLRLDGELCPKDTKPYQALLSRIPKLGYSALAWWDNTVDHRPGSNSIIFAPSLTCSVESIQTAMTKWFPWVEARLPQSLIILPYENSYTER